MASPPSAAPAPAKRSGPGCLVALVLLPVVIVLGIVIGTVLSQEDEPPQETSVTLDEGTIDGVAWRVDAERDIEGDSCAFLYQDGEQLTGACTVTPQDATIGDQTVVFGRAEDGVTSVRVELDTGEVVQIDTTTVEAVVGTFFVQVVDGDVDAERFS